LWRKGVDYLVDDHPTLGAYVGPPGLSAIAPTAVRSYDAGVACDVQGDNRTSVRIVWYNRDARIHLMVQP
jgi:hypothetical protein